MLVGVPGFMICLTFPIIDFLEILYELLTKDDIDSPANVCCCGLPMQWEIDQNLIVGAGIRSVMQLPSDKQTCFLNTGLGHQYFLQINELGQ